MSSQENLRPYDWQEQNDFTDDVLPPKQLHVAQKFLDLMSVGSGNVISEVDQEAATLREMLAERGIDVSNPKQWFCLLEGSKLFDQIVDSQLRTRPEGPTSLADFDYEAQDRVWQVMAALMPLSIKTSRPINQNVLKSTIYSVLNYR